MNKSIAIILALCVLVSVIIICVSCKIKSGYQKQKLSVAILVISISNSKNSNKRWQIEKHNWLHIYKHPTWADVFLIECENIKENFTKVSKYNCTESMNTGIFQKTILAIEKLLSQKYNYFIRTNLSTFIIYNRLYKYLEKIGIVNKPIYRGVYCHNNWVAGFGIILNKVAAKKLVEIGKDPKFFNKKASDDVIIGQIMKSIDCACLQNEILLYQWIYSKSNNIYAITNNDKIFIRLRASVSPRNKSEMISNLKNYLQAINTLVDKFSK